MTDDPVKVLLEAALAGEEFMCGMDPDDIVEKNARALRILVEAIAPMVKEECELGHDTDVSEALAAAAGEMRR